MSTWLRSSLVSHTAHSISLTFFFLDWENHRTFHEHENSLILKLFSFQFLNEFGTLLYIAFVKPYGEKDVIELHPTDETDYCIRARDSPLITEEHKNCYEELRYQYMGILLMKVVVDALKDFLLPLLKRKWRAFRIAGASISEAIVEEDCEDKEGSADARKHELEDEIMMPPYESALADFNQIVLTFGFVAMFGIAFPLGSLIVAFYGVAQSGVDSHKLLHFCQRPLSKECDNIGADSPSAII